LKAAVWPTSKLGNILLINNNNIVSELLLIHGSFPEAHVFATLHTS